MKREPTNRIDDHLFICYMRVEYPAMSNEELAAHCTKEFGRYVTEAYIKGMLFRLRAEGRLPS